MPLQQLTEQVYIYQGGVNFGVIMGTEKRLILVDSGLDSGSARKALRPLLEAGYTLAAIINTHSHADHIGGNADLVKRTGCEVWAPAKERPFLLWPELEPIGLYGGAWPPPGLQVKFLQAQPTAAVRELPTAPATMTLAGVSLELVPTPGHSLEHVAIAVDGVLLAGDALFDAEVLGKHPIIFLVNVVEYLGSLARLGARTERYVLPGHGQLIDREREGGDPLPQVLCRNREAVQRIQDLILDTLAQPSTAEEVLYAVVAGAGKVLESEPQYYLDRAAVSAHLSYLIQTEQVNAVYQGGRRLMARV